MKRDIELKNVELYQENSEHFLALTYIKNFCGNEYEVKIPKVNLNFLNGNFVISRTEIDSEFKQCSIEYYYPHQIIMDLSQDDNKKYFYQKPLKKKMTLKDIEKELGYKIELTNEEEGE